MIIIQEMEKCGCFHAGLYWPLTKQRQRRSTASRKGGLWKWMDLSIIAWLKDIHKRSPFLSTTIGSLQQILHTRGIITPMDLNTRPPLTPTSFPTLTHADRGILVFESHIAVQAIRMEASRTVQMYLRRLLVSNRLVRSIQQRVCQHNLQMRLTSLHGLSSDQTESSTAITHDIAHELHTTQIVLDVMETLVDTVVMQCRRDKYMEMAMAIKTTYGETPERTEVRGGHRLY